MTLEECYAAMNGNYADAIGRLRSERLIQKFVLKLPQDDSFDLLCRSWDAKDYKEAFRAAHTIKGICQNLSITRLGESASRLTEALRGGWTPAADGLVEEVKGDYRDTVDAIRTFEAGLAAT